MKKLISFFLFALALAPMAFGQQIDFGVGFDNSKAKRDQGQLKVIHPNRIVCSQNGRGVGPGTDWRCTHAPGTCVNIQSAVTNGKFKSKEELAEFLKTLTINAPEYGQNNRTGFRLATEAEAAIYTAKYKVMTMASQIYGNKGYQFVFIVGFDQPNIPVGPGTPIASATVASAQ